MVHRYGRNFVVLLILAFSSIQSVYPAAEDVLVDQPGSDDMVVADKHGEDSLGVARQHIEDAIESYQEGDAAASHRSLDLAIEALDEATRNSLSDAVRDEAFKLGAEIESFKRKLDTVSEENRSDLSRFWHQALSMLKQETEHLVRRYKQLSTSEKTLKHLLDAKMHLFVAKHDLYVGHDDAHAVKELNDVLNYLEEASQVASVPVKKSISDLIDDITSLRSRIEVGEAERVGEEVVLYLDQASSRLKAARNVASPESAAHIKLIEEQVRALSVSTGSESIKGAYDSSITQLNKIIDSL